MRPGLSDRVSGAAASAAGLGLIALAWEVIGRGELAGPFWPPLSEVVSHIMDADRSGAVWRGFAATIQSMLRGLVVGTLIAIVLAFIGVVIEWFRPGFERLVTSLQAIPVIAFGPILIVVVGREAAPAYVAGIATLYPVFVSTTAGLTYVSKTYLDVAAASGATPARVLRHVRVPSALPFLLDGLRLAIPLAVVGAIIGEWFGAPRGLGVVLVASLQNYLITQLWAAALVGAGFSVLLYGLVSLLHRATVARRAL